MTLCFDETFKLIFFQLIKLIKLIKIIVAFQKILKQKKSSKSFRSGYFFRYLVKTTKLQP